MAEKTKPKTRFVGRWRIRWMDQWDQEYVDEEAEGFVELDPKGPRLLLVRLRPTVGVRRKTTPITSF